MTHIFEFYEETFPDHSLKANSSPSISQESSDKSERNNQFISSDKTAKMVDHNSEITTPTDVETPAKEIITYKINNGNS
jgi:hypothetical protein